MKKMMKSKGMKRGGKMKAKGMKRGGKTKGGAAGGAMPLASIRAAASKKGYKLVKV